MWCDSHQVHVTVHRDLQSGEKEVKVGTQVRTVESWFKITVSVLARSALARVLWDLIEGRSRSPRCVGCVEKTL